MAEAMHLDSDIFSRDARGRVRHHDRAVSLSVTVKPATFNRIEILKPYTLTPKP